MAEEGKKRRMRTDEELYADLMKKAGEVKQRIEAKKQKDYEPICKNLGDLLLQMSGYDLAGLNSENKDAIKRSGKFAKAQIKEMARMIVEKYADEKPEETEAETEEPKAE